MLQPTADLVSASATSRSRALGARAPMRRCVGCREADTADSLVRFVLDPAGQLAVDLPRQLPGRGASVHPRLSCLRAAADRGGFSRGFRRQVSVNAEGLGLSVQNRLRDRVDALLIRAARVGGLRIGEDPVRNALGEVETVVLGTERASEMLRGALTRNLEAGRCVVHRDVESLDRLLGRGTEGVLGILDRHIAQDVCEVARRAEALVVSRGAQQRSVE